MADQIRDEQLMRFQRALRTAEARVPDAVQKAKENAAGLVVAEARGHAPRGPHQGGGTVQPLFTAIHVQSDARRAYVVFGGPQSPHGPVYEFGGSIPRRGARATHGAAIAFAKARRRSFASVGVPRTQIEARPHVYPAIASEGGPMLAAFEQAVLKIARDL